MDEPRDPWALEKEDSFEENIVKLEFKPKVHLVLEGSEQFEWGVVKDCHGSINTIPSDAEVVGTWNRYGDGTYWVDLTTPVEAMLDRLTQLYKELADNREKLMAKMGILPKPARMGRVRTKQEPVAEQPKPKDDTFDRLRAMLGKSE